MKSTFNENQFEYNPLDNFDFTNNNQSIEIEPISQIGTYVKKYLDRGWTVLKIPYKSKSPTDNAWQKMDPNWINNNASDINSKFIDGGNNIGIRLDHPLVDIDLDCGEARLLASHYLPDTNCIFGRKSARSSHWVYNVDDNLPMKRFNGAKPVPKRSPGLKTPGVQDTIVEYRAGNTVQTVFPGSVHGATGEKIDWESGRDKDPTKVSANHLFECVRTLAAASLILEYYPNQGHRNLYILNVIGGLLTGGYTKEKTRELLEPVIIEAEVNCVGGAFSDSSAVLKERLTLIDRTMEKIEKGENISGFPTLTKEDIVTEKFTSKLKEFLSLRYKNSGKKCGASAEPFLINRWPVGI